MCQEMLIILQVFFKTSVTVTEVEEMNKMQNINITTPLVLCAIWYLTKIKTPGPIVKYKIILRF